MKLNIDQMVNMSQLFEKRTDEQLNVFRDELYDAAERAGVYVEAIHAGLTIEQWEVVKNPRAKLRDFILAL